MVLHFGDAYQSFKEECYGRVCTPGDHHWEFKAKRQVGVWK